MTRRSLGTIVLAMLLLFQTGCKKETKEEAGAAQTLSVGLLLDEEKDTSRKKLVEGFRAECAALGYQFQTFTADNDARKQEDQCQQAIKAGINYLVWIPVAEGAYSNIPDWAESSNVPLAALYRLPENREFVDVLLDFEDKEVGNIIGRYVDEHVPKGSSIFWITEENKISSGIDEYIKPREEAKELDCVKKETTDPDELKLTMEWIQNEKGSFRGVIAETDQSAKQAAKIMQNMNLHGITLTGVGISIDTANRILDGTQSMSIFQDSRKLAKEACNWIQNQKRNTAQHLQESDAQVPVIYVSSQVVVKSNVKEVLIDTGYFEKEELET